MAAKKKSTKKSTSRKFVIPMTLKAKKKNSVRFAAAKDVETAVTDIYLLNFAAEDATEIRVTIEIVK